MNLAKAVFCILGLSVVFNSAVLAVPTDLYAFADPQESARFAKLTTELRCLVCQNQSLADSDAPLAQDLRHKIYVMMNQKQSDAAIKQFLVSRYGEFILFSPPLSKRTLLLWSFPILLFIIIFSTVLWRSQT
jgi:cytochrome c-type biogenesis protein CcmH